MTSRDYVTRRRKHWPIRVSSSLIDSQVAQCPAIDLVRNFNDDVLRVPSPCTHKLRHTWSGFRVSAWWHRLACTFGNFLTQVRSQTRRSCWSLPWGETWRKPDDGPWFSFWRTFWCCPVRDAWWRVPTSSKHSVVEAATDPSTERMCTSRCPPWSGMCRCLRQSDSSILPYWQAGPTPENTTLQETMS